jgi:phosphoesterase RecJ-like protein
LESLGKKVTVIAGDSTIPQAFMHFPGAESVLAKSYGELDLADYNLFVIQDCGSKEMISRKTQVEFPSTLRTVVIDHHATNTKYAEVNLVANQYLSTTEILFDLFQEWGISITHDIAVNLYVGLFTDTGGFRYERVTEHSFSVAGKLCAVAPDMINAVKILENSARPGFVNFLGVALTQKTVVPFKNSARGSFVIARVTQEDIQRLGIASDDWAGNEVCNMLKTVVGWNVACLLIEQRPGDFRGSMRSRNFLEFDVSLVASKLGGGGHKSAAGFVLQGSMEEVVLKVESTIQEVLG